MNSNMEKNETQASSEYQENLGILRQIDFFSGLPLEATKVFAYLCTRETFRPGDYLFQQDEEGDRAYYIISGSARLNHRIEDTDNTLRDYSAGVFIGRLALMGKMRRLFSLRARTDVTCLVIGRKKFTLALEQFPDIVPKIIKVLVDNIYNWEKRVLADGTVVGTDWFQQIGVSLV